MEELKDFDSLNTKEIGEHTWEWILRVLEPGGQKIKKAEGKPNQNNLIRLNLSTWMYLPET